jgi:2-dehydropantoate 2-reductase
VRILVFGAGVIGSLYGASLAATGHEATLHARGGRVEELARDGVVL